MKNKKIPDGTAEPQNNQFPTCLLTQEDRCRSGKNLLHWTFCGWIFGSVRLGFISFSVICNGKYTIFIAFDSKTY